MTIFASRRISILCSKLKIRTRGLYINADHPFTREDRHLTHGKICMTASFHREARSESDWILELFWRRCFWLLLLICLLCGNIHVRRVSYARHTTARIQKKPQKNPTIIQLVYINKKNRHLWLSVQIVKRQLK